MRHASRASAFAIVLAVATTAGCGSSAASPVPSDGSGTPTPTPAGPAATAGVTPAPPAVGNARANVTIGGSQTVISGGTCGVNEFPPDFGGGHGFYANIGKVNFEDGGPDYLGILIGIPGPGAEANGTYESTWSNATGTLVAGGVYTALGDIVLTIADEGASATLESVVRDDDTPVEIEITC